MNPAQFRSPPLSRVYPASWSRSPGIHARAARRPCSSTALDSPDRRLRSTPVLQTDPPRKPGRAAYPLLLPTWLVLGVFFLAPARPHAGRQLRRAGHLWRPEADRRTSGATCARARSSATTPARSTRSTSRSAGGRSGWPCSRPRSASSSASPSPTTSRSLAPPAAGRALLLGLVVVPFWTSFLIRTYAWMFILRTEGLVNLVLMGAGLLRHPLELLYTQTARADRPRLRRAAVHDPAPLRLAGEARPLAAGGRRRTSGAGGRRVVPAGDRSP